jgi:hypothetical protein
MRSTYCNAQWCCSAEQRNDPIRLHRSKERNANQQRMLRRMLHRPSAQKHEQQRQLMRWMSKQQAAVPRAMARMLQAMLLRQRQRQRPQRHLQQQQQQQQQVAVDHEHLYHTNQVQYDCWQRVPDSQRLSQRTSQSKPRNMPQQWYNVQEATMYSSRDTEQLQVHFHTWLCSLVRRCIKHAHLQHLVMNQRIINTRYEMCSSGVLAPSQ